jgi:hypothetical protein
LAVNNFSIRELPDKDLDCLIDAVGHAYGDNEQAKLFEAVGQMA